METKKELLVRILNEYSCISVEKAETDYAEFELYGAKYAIHLFDDNGFPLVLAIDHAGNYPHFLYNDKIIHGHNYRYICLYESGSLIEFIHTDEEKVRFSISRLITLVELSSSEIVAELQKEFLYYWNSACSSKGKHARYEYQLFLDDDDTYQWLEQWHFKSNIIRITKTERFFNDSSNKVFCDKIPVLYIPILDSTGIMPPLPDSPWSSREIVDIVGGLKHQRISSEAYQEICRTSYTNKEIILVFKLNSYFFACSVEFSNPGVEKLIVKFESRIIRVTPIKVSRCDFEFLNEQIGNEPIYSKIAIVGGGSLGSYVASELVRSGYKNIELFDPDIYDFANIFRHRLPYYYVHYNKSLLGSRLNAIHPELNVSGQGKYIDSSNVELLRSADIIIIAVGNSDAELIINSALKQQGITVPVFHVWLESDGATSHVAAIRDQEKGCFECLYTDQNGDYCPNIINRAAREEIKYIRNGCGGTRVPYGNKTLLTAAALLITALEDETPENRVYSFIDNHFETVPFPRNERCRCCGVCK